MFGDYVFEKTAAQYTKKMMLVDADHLEEKAHYSAVFQAHGFRTVVYTDDLNFRVNNTSLLNGEEKLAILEYCLSIFQRTNVAFAALLSLRKRMQR